MNFRFDKGQQVRYKLDRKIMLVVEYERTTGIIKLGRIQQDPPSYTGRVQCSWTEGNLRKTEYYYDYELEPIAETMFDALETDIVSLLKKATGEIINNIKASVQANKIFTTGGHVLIESGDLIYRKMTNGGEETYQVIDPGFHEEFHGMPAGYQIKVKKLGLPEAETEKHNIVYNISFTGNNNRFNKDSLDQSTNISKIQKKIDEHLESLRKEINQLKISAVDKQDLVELLEALEDQINSGKPKLGVVKTIIGTLSTRGAEIASIGALILQLTQSASV
jgi:hypothetical protein